MYITHFTSDTQIIRMTSLLDDEFVCDKIEREKYDESLKSPLDSGLTSPASMDRSIMLAL